MKTEELIALLEQHGKALLATAGKLQKEMGEKVKETPITKKPALTLEDIRAVAADKSRSGYTDQVRELLHKYGAEKHSAMDASHYDAFLRDLEVLGHAK